MKPIIKYLNKEMVRHIHFIGIGGVSMSGLAQIVLHMGFTVSGSDMCSSSLTQKLQTLGIQFFEEHDSENIRGADLVIYTAAVKQDNPELSAALQKQIPTIERAVILGEIMDYFQFSIAVSGTHGKTTTTSMISMIMLEASKNPTIHIGGKLNAIEGNTKVGSRDYFITEACEYVDSFLHFFPDLSIILNLEEDHLDYFNDLTHIQTSFVRFLNQTSPSGYVVVNNDEPNIRTILPSLQNKIITFGINTASDYYASDIKFSSTGLPSFIFHITKHKHITIELSVPGLHNVSNALAAATACHLIGCSPEAIALGLKKFNGTGRRFEWKGEINEVQVVDDYAHHPSEVKATLQAAKKTNYKNIWCIFQPHTFTRTKAFLDEFSAAFTDANHVIVTDIYAAREKNPGDITSEMLVEKIKTHHPNANYIKNFDTIVDFLREHVKSGDLILTMGAGNIYQVAEMYLAKS